MAGKGVVRSIKNYAKGFSDVQIKVREATSNDTWGPSGSLMNEIAQLTFNEQDFIEIMDMLDRRLNDKGKNWRHVFKALLVLDYCLHVGSENVVLYAKENIYVVKTLKEFQHIDDTGKDVGFNVRQKAKDITSLLLDDQRLKEERRSRHQMQDRMAGVGDYMNDVMWGGKANGSGGEDHQVYQHPGYVDEDKDLKKAIEESKRMAEQEFRKRGEGTDEDLQRALRESEQEAREAERKKREALDRETQNNLFGNASSSSNNNSSSNFQAFQAFPANQSFDSSLNPYGQQQQQQQQQLQQQQQWPQSTGLTGMSFAEPIQQQQQQQNNGFSNPYQQANNFNQFSLQAQMTGVPSLQAQMTGMPQQQQQQQPIFQTQQAQMTGNPFGQQQQQANSASMFGTPSQIMHTASPAMSQSTPTSTTPQNPHYSKLNSMLANREGGSDSFGNVGDHRIPYGTGFANSLVPQNKDILSITDSPTNSQNGAFSQPFGQQPSRNPFGQATSSASTPTTPHSGQKSLLEMMQEQKLQQQQQQQQQQLQAQMTGYQQPQMTGFQQPQMTGFQPAQNVGYQQAQMTGYQQQQQQPNNFQQAYGQPQQPQQQQPSFF